MIKIEQYILLRDFGTNTWLLYDDDSKQGILIDPAAADRSLMEYITRNELKINLIINTHGHLDHIGGNSFFKDALKCKIAIHPKDAPKLVDSKKNLSAYIDSPVCSHPADQLLEDGDTIKLGSEEIKIIHTPGHTAGCICLYIAPYLISGDTLFERSIGRTDFPDGNHQQIIDSIKTKLFVLPEDTIVFPGHGPQTTIGLEKKNNPFVN